MANTLDMARNQQGSQAPGVAPGQELWIQSRAEHGRET